MKFFSNLTKSKIIIFCFFLISQSVSAWFIYNKFNSQTAEVPRISNSVDQWIYHLGAGDSGTYLRVAKNFAEGHGISDFCKECNPPSYIPFYFWGPGTPVYLAAGLKLFGQNKAKSLFYLFLITNFIGGLIILATSFLIINSTLGKIVIACLVSYIPPIHEHISSNLFSASEIACFIPFAVFYYYLFKTSESSNDYRNQWKLYFFSGLALGIVVLVRESNLMFGYFLVAIMIALAAVNKSKNWKQVLKNSFAFIVALQIVILPIKLWNKDRLNVSIISSSGSSALWRYGLWARHDSADWYVTSGIGFGQYLDSDAAKRVEESYMRGEGSALLSLKELSKAILNKPIEAIKFKVNRIPVLWLGTTQWPLSELTFMSAWCLFFLLSLLIYYGLLLYQKKRIPLPFYVYGLFLFLASGLIHFEFRYTQPVWYVLIFIPVLLVEELILIKSTEKCVT